MKRLIISGVAACGLVVGTLLSTPTAHADPCADNPNPPNWWQCPARTPAQQHDDQIKKSICTYFRSQYPEDCVYY